MIGVRAFPELRVAAAIWCSRTSRVRRLGLVRHGRDGADDDADLAAVGHAEHADAEPAADCGTRVGFAAASRWRGDAGRDPHLVGDGGAVDGPDGSVRG